VREHANKTHNSKRDKDPSQVHAQPPAHPASGSSYRGSADRQALRVIHFSGVGRQPRLMARWRTRGAAVPLPLLGKRWQFASKYLFRWLHSWVKTLIFQGTEGVAERFKAAVLKICPASLARLRFVLRSPEIRAFLSR
jgi:hypothetical protein